MDSDPTAAAGWAIVGVGTALGLGSAVTGGLLLVDDPSKDEKRVGIATLAGGLVTIATALIIGVPLTSTSSTKADRQTATALMRAMSGEFRF